MLHFHKTEGAWHTFTFKKGSNLKAKAEIVCVSVPSMTFPMMQLNSGSAAFPFKVDLEFYNSESVF